MHPTNTRFLGSSVLSLLPFLTFLTLLHQANATQQQSPLIPSLARDCLVQTCLPKWDFCGPCDHPCCCDDPPICCAKGEGCQIHNFTIPGGDPDFAFLKRYGSKPSHNIPCCGKGCTADQCLRLILIELQTLEAPLELQQSKFKPVPDEERCCGQNCSDAQCFQDVKFTFVDLQNPIRLTLNETGKYEELLDDGEEGLDEGFRIEI